MDLQTLPPLVRSGQGAELLRALGDNAPRLLRIRELAIRPATNSELAGAPILVVSAEFDDGEIRARNWPLDDVLYLMLRAGDAAIVTAEFQRFVHGTVTRHGQIVAPTPKGAAGVSVEMLGSVLTPLTETISGEVSKLRKQLAEQTQRAADAQKQIAERDRQLERHAQHLARLQTKVTQLEARQP